MSVGRVWLFCFTMSASLRTSMKRDVARYNANQLTEDTWAGLFELASSVHSPILCSLSPECIRTVDVGDSLGIRLDSMPGPSRVPRFPIAFAPFLVPLCPFFFQISLLFNLCRCAVFVLDLVCSRSRSRSLSFPCSVWAKAFRGLGEPRKGWWAVLRK